MFVTRARFVNKISAMFVYQCYVYEPELCLSQWLLRRAMFVNQCHVYKQKLHECMFVNQCYV